MTTENITGIPVENITGSTVENINGTAVDNITGTTIENVAGTTFNTTMNAEQTTVSVHAVWIPYIALVILFLMGLGFSFKRHHMRQIKKRQHIVEYQEKSLSARKPRIQGKLGHFGDAIGSIPPTMLMASSSQISPAMGHSWVNSQDDGSYRPLQSSDVHLSFFSDVTPDRDSGVKRRYRSETELNNQKKSYYRLLSEDDYFRRKGPRDSYYVKSACERHLSPGRNRQRIRDSDNAHRAFWVRSDVNNQDVENQRVEAAVKYIKVFDLDLCHDCRLYVERVDGGVRKCEPHRTSETTTSMTSVNRHLQTSPSHIADPLSVHHQNNKTTNEDPPSYELASQTAPQLSIAEIHAPPTSGPAHFQPVLSGRAGSPGLLRFAEDFASSEVFSAVQQPQGSRTSGKHNGSIEIQLSPLDVERPRSAPDLSSEGNTNSDYFKRGMQDSAFKLRPQFSFNPRRQAPTPQRRPRGRDKSGVFWLDLDTHQHTLV